MKARSPMCLRIAAVVVGLFAAFFPLVIMAVGGRGQDSTVVATATSTASSSPALVPAPSDRAVGDEVMVPLEEIQAMLPVLAAPPVEPASTVTQSALTATVQAYLVIDPVPATPPARFTNEAKPESQAGKVSGSESYAPWPEYLWPVVACLVERESKGNPEAVGGQGERGLLQIGVANFAYLATYGITPDMLFDGPTNIRAGWIISLYWQKATGDGFAPWASTRGGCA